MKWLARVLSARYASAWVVVAAVVLTLPTLTLGFLLDDYSHRLMLDPSFEFPGGRRAVWDLFRFLDEDRGAFRELLASGVAPWWTSPDFRLAFLRPLTSLTHAFDYTFFPAHAFPMHLENVALYGAVVAIVAALYRRTLGPPWIAVLAALMFAVDDAHGFVVGWIANRNAVLAAVLGFGALLAHTDAREAAGSSGALGKRAPRKRAMAVVAPVLFALALLSGEAALGALVYILSYAIWLDDAPVRARVLSLAPYAGIAAAWLISYRALGYGAEGGGFYFDPVREPVAYILAVLERAPVLLLAQFGIPPSEFWFLVPRHRVIVASAFLGLVVILGGIIVWKVVGRERSARFFATGMLLSTLPVCATWPSDRLLLMMGFGAFGLIALFLAKVRDLVGPWRIAATPLSVAFIAVHLVIAPILFPIREVAAAPIFRRPIEHGAATLYAEGGPDDKTYVVLNAPNALFPLFSMSKRFVDTGARRHTQVRLLGVAVEGTFDVERVDERTLALEFGEGFPHEPLSRFFRGSPFRPGEEIETSGLRVRVESCNADGDATRVAFRFDVPLDDPKLAWFVWEKRGFVRYKVPEVGVREHRAPISVMNGGVE